MTFFLYETIFFTSLNLFGNKNILISFMVALQVVLHFTLVAIVINHYRKQSLEGLLENKCYGNCNQSSWKNLWSWVFSNTTSCRPAALLKKNSFKGLYEGFILQVFLATFQNTFFKNNFTRCEFSFHFNKIVKNFIYIVGVTKQM